MNLFGRGNRTPIGVDIGARRIKAAQLRRRGNVWHIEAAANFDRAAASPFDTQEVRRLAEVLSRQGFVGRDVVIAVPEEKLFYGVLELPPRNSGAPLDQIARMELARMRKCEPHSFEMAWWDLPAPARASKSTNVMAVATAHADADALLNEFDREGLHVSVLDVEAWALARACEPMLAGCSGVAAVLDIGWNASLEVMLLNGAVVYERTFSDGAVGKLHQTLREKLQIDSDVADFFLNQIGLSDGEADGRTDWNVRADAREEIARHFSTLVEEIRMSFNYALHQYRDTALQKLLVVGGGGAMPGLAEFLSTTLGIEVAVACPSVLAQCRPELLGVCASAEMTTALGLAQYAGDGA